MKNISTICLETLLWDTGGVSLRQAYNKNAAPPSYKGEAANQTITR